MKKLIYVDSYSYGSFHEGFNASSLKMFSEIYDNIIYYATPSSKNEVSNMLKGLPLNVTYKSIFLFKPNGLVGRFMRNFISSIWNVIILLFAPKDSVVFYNFNSLWGMNIINRIVRWRKIKTIIMCHGELEYIISGVRLNHISHKYLHLFVSTKFISADNLYFCVAGNSILSNLEGVISPQIIDKFISFEHTFISHDISQTSIIPTSTIKIGTVGTMGQTKGLSDIVKLGEMLKGVKNIELYTLGRIRCDISILKSANIKYIPESDVSYVSKDVLDDYISSMDCLFFMYPENGYKLTASGALYDAINANKVILSLHNDYFDGIFKRINAGRLFDSFEDMSEFITQQRFKEIQDVDFDNNKHLMSPEYEAVQFRKTLLDVGLY